MNFWGVAAVIVSVAAIVVVLVIRKRALGRTCVGCGGATTETDVGPMLERLLQKFGADSHPSASELNAMVEMASIVATTGAWQCDRCHRLLCNACLIDMITATGPLAPHAHCGDVFRPPRP
ncbi:hypothetical protein [Actinokineospora sp.]|uniref:hypothetical protein n=1 Tax=Actinokineospora sp. TaxID=1872133 RepID=UPI004037F1B2